MRLDVSAVDPAQVRETTLEDTNQGHFPEALDQQKQNTCQAIAKAREAYTISQILVDQS